MQLRTEQVDEDGAERKSCNTYPNSGVMKIQDVGIPARGMMPSLIRVPALFET